MNQITELMVDWKENVRFPSWLTDRGKSAKNTEFLTLKKVSPEKHWW